MFVRSSPFNSYVGQVSSSPKVTQVCLHIFKQTLEEMSLKIEAFCVAGLGGTCSLLISDFGLLICLAAAISATTGLEKLNRVKAQKAIQEKISLGLR